MKTSTTVLFVTLVLMQMISWSEARKGANVGFTATFQSDENYDLSAKQTVPFTRIIHNTGKSFDRTTGVFTCPNKGLYLFSVSLISAVDNADNWAMLQKNGETVIYVNTGPNRDDRGSATAVIHLNVEDKVAVKSQLNSTFRDESYFSGVLISAE